jgi:type II secretory ATPase GspE/PulE/Tfp pilus assembly ATPase PilB-like protein
MCDGLQDWIGRTLVRAVTLKAREIQYERGRDGLTVRFRRGEDVLETLGPYKRYQHTAFSRLDRMGRQGLPKRLKGETGRFLTVWDGREWNCPVFHTRTRSGERVVVRFTSSKPDTGPRG